MIPKNPRHGRMWRAVLLATANSGWASSVSTKWRIVSEMELGGWMIHELAFFEDIKCTRRIRNHLRTLESGHRGSFKPSHAFDLLADVTDRFFWYSKQGYPWLGFETFRPVEVRCVELFHNNLPEVPVALQRWRAAEQDWFSVHRWDAEGATWTYLVVEAKETKEAKEAKEDEENEQHRNKAIAIGEL